MCFYPITLVINLYFITRSRIYNSNFNSNKEPKAHNFERNGLSNENLFEYNQASSKKPPKDNLTTKFNLSRYKIITTQRIKTRIQKLKKQSNQSRNPPRDKEKEKLSKRLNFIQYLITLNLIFMRETRVYL